MLTLDKSYSFETEHLAVEPIISEVFDLLVSNLTCNAPTRILVQELELPSTFTGNLLVDNVFHAGNNSTRFTFFKVTSGVIDLETREHIKLDRKSNERVFANNKLRNYPEIVNHSILNSSQKKAVIERSFYLSNKIIINKGDCTLDIGKSIRNRLETLGKSESMLTSNVLLDESEQLIVNNLMNNKITFYLVEEHILGVICHELHCTLADLLNLDSGRISFSESINSDDEKAKQVKIAVDDYINDFEFVTNIK